MAELRELLGIRLIKEDRQFFIDAAAEAGLEGGTAARQLVELAIRHMRSGADYIDTLQIVKNALKPRVRVQAGRAT